MACCSDSLPIEACPARPLGPVGPGVSCLAGGRRVRPGGARECFPSISAPINTFWRSRRGTRSSGLSTRATKSDSYLAAGAGGLPQHRATSEQILNARPLLVVRYWGGEPRLLADLGRRGIGVITLKDATDFTGVADNVLAVADAVGARGKGEALVGAMNRQLRDSRGAWRGRGALYVTSGGFTAGPGTLIDAMLRAAGLTNLATAPGYHAISLESLVRRPPAVLVEGFFDAPLNASQRWSEMRSPLLAHLAARATTVSLPGSLLACPAWFAADGVALIARRAPGRGP